jgi:hypothetical protein
MSPNKTTLLTLSSKSQKSNLATTNSLLVQVDLKADDDTSQSPTISNKIDHKIGFSNKTSVNVTQSSSKIKPPMEENNTQVSSTIDNSVTTVTSRPQAVLSNHYLEPIVNLIQEEDTNSSKKYDEIDDISSSATRRQHDQTSSSRQKSSTVVITRPYVMANFTFDFLIRNAMFVFSHLTNHSMYNRNILH